MKFCPECGGYLPTSPNFCNWCGFCLNKKCSSCANYSFSKYCIECGNHMVPSHTVLVKTEVNNVVLKNEQAYSEPIRENIKQTSDLNNNSKLTVENQVSFNVNLLMRPCPTQTKYNSYFIFLNDIYPFISEKALCWIQLFSI